MCDLYICMSSRININLYHMNLTSIYPFIHQNCMSSSSHSLFVIKKALWMDIVDEKQKNRRRKQKETAR